MDRPDWAPPEIALDTPSAARMYDALLGGSHNFAVDRQAAAGATRLVPDLKKFAIANRVFLRRAVRFLAKAGIRQFLDIGAGIPTVGNTHESARQAAPGCRVAYVDIDPVAVAHANAILEADPDSIAVRGDLRTPDRLLADPRLRDFLDLERPVGVLLVSVLHLVTDADEPWQVVAALRDAVAPGSYFAISHLTSAQRPEDAAALSGRAAQRANLPIIFRDRAKITRFFDGLALVDPGVVELSHWRPETPEDVLEVTGRSLGLAGVGHRA